MTEAADIVEREAQMLGRLAELDLAAVEKVHAQLMQAEAAHEVADLGRTYQRFARSLRQTLALKARLAGERMRHARVRREEAARARTARAPQDETALEARKAEIREAVTRVAWDEYERTDAEEVLLEFEDLLPLAAAEESFLTAPVPIVAARLCALLEIPWRTVPPVEAEALEPAPDAAPATPRRSSG
jgi:hypothetical protein